MIIILYENIRLAVRDLTSNYIMIINNIQYKYTTLQYVGT